MIRNLIASALTVSLLLGATAALAGDKKNYAGAACLSRFANTPGLLREGGKLMSEYNQTVPVTCPALKDTATSVRGHMHVIDLSSAEFVSCTMFTRSRTGGSLGMAKRCTGGDCSNTANKLFASPDPYHLDFNTSLSGPDNTYVFFECSLPPSSSNAKSGVVSFEVDEL